MKNLPVMSFLTFVLSMTILFGTTIYYRKEIFARNIIREKVEVSIVWLSEQIPVDSIKPR